MLADTAVQSTKLKRVLVAEDEGIVALDLETKLTQFGYSVVACVHSGEDAIQQARALRPDVVLMDIRLRGEIDGVQAAEAIRRDPVTLLIYLTASSDGETFGRAKHTAPSAYLIKPINAEELRCAIELALHKHAQKPPANTGMTVREVATYLNVDEKTVYRIAKRRGIPGFRVGGTWRFRQSDIDAWIARSIEVPCDPKEDR